MVRSKESDNVMEQKFDAERRHRKTFPKFADIMSVFVLLLFVVLHFLHALVLYASAMYRVSGPYSGRGKITAVSTPLCRSFSLHEFRGRPVV